MNQLDILLFHGFNSNGSDIGSRNRNKNHFRIIKIIFVAFEKGFDMAGFEKYDVMTQSNELSCQIMRATASLYADQTYSIIRGKTLKLVGALTFSLILITLIGS